jgi:hypothetical protein
LLQIGDGDPIVLRLDQVELALDRPDGAPRFRARVTLELGATPEFMAWWDATNAAALRRALTGGEDQ